MALSLRAVVAAGALTQARALAVARQIQEENSLDIDERVLARFLAALVDLYFRASARPRS